MPITPQLLLIVLALPKLAAADPSGPQLIDVPAAAGKAVSAAPFAVVESTGYHEVKTPTIVAPLGLVVRFQSWYSTPAGARGEIEEELARLSDQCYVAWIKETEKRYGKNYVMPAKADINMKLLKMEFTKIDARGSRFSGYVGWARLTGCGGWLRISSQKEVLTGHAEVDQRLGEAIVFGKVINFDDRHNSKLRLSIQFDKENSGVDGSLLEDRPQALPAFFHARTKSAADEPKCPGCKAEDDHRVRVLYHASGSLASTGDRSGPPKPRDWTDGFFMKIGPFQFSPESVKFSPEVGVGWGPFNIASVGYEVDILSLKKAPTIDFGKPSGGMLAAAGVAITSERDGQASTPKGLPRRADFGARVGVKVGENSLKTSEEHLDRLDPHPGKVEAKWEPQFSRFGGLSVLHLPDYVNTGTFKERSVVSARVAYARFEVAAYGPAVSGSLDFVVVPQFIRHGVDE